MTLLPVRSVRIAYLTGPFDRRRVPDPTQAFAVPVQPIDLLREACTCLAAGTCDVCQAWAAARHRHEARLAHIRQR
jgi:hypothetical protein